MLETDITREGTAIAPGSWAVERPVLFAITEPEFRNRADKLTRSVRRILTDPADVEDAVQQTFLKALANFHLFRGEASMDTWLTRIAINEALLHLRKSRSAHLVAYEEQREGGIEAVMSRPPSSMPDPEKMLFQREISELIENALASLPPACRALLLMRYADGLSDPQIASQIGLTASATKTRVFRARHRLLQALGRNFCNGRTEWEKAMLSRCLVARRRPAALHSGQRDSKGTPPKTAQLDAEPAPRLSPASIESPCPSSDGGIGGRFTQRNS
jgi:RNA polymerase sigma-70 factor, ECF subfamily